MGDHSCVRDRIIILTKVGLPMGEGMEGLGRNYLPKACEASLRRLQTDYIDVYKAHKSDEKTPIEESLETFQSLINAGKARYVGGSNYKPEELEAALTAAGHGRARYDVFEPHYNLADRHMFEGPLEDICVRYGVGVVTYYSLASGFLIGKYRNPDDMKGSNRTRMVSQNLNERGLKLLDVIDTVAARHGATLAQISLAWLLARPSVTAPVASATKVPQLKEILKAAEIVRLPRGGGSISAQSPPGPYKFYSKPIGGALSSPQRYGNCLHPENSRDPVENAGQLRR